MVYKLYIYHPYQNMYFNNLLTNKDKLNYERDTNYLTRLDFFRKVLNYSSNDNKRIKIGNASWGPLEDVLNFFVENEKKKIELLGNANLEQSDFIFTNYMYDVNILFNKKYNIPQNFILLESVVKDGTLIYSIYKKK